MLIKLKQYNMPSGIYKRKPISEETRKRLCISKSGKNNPFSGKKHSKETIKKMSISSSGENCLPETRKKMSIANSGKNNPFYGKKHSKKNKEKMSIANLGKKVSEKTRKKLSILNLGAKSPQWLGGKSFEPYTVDWTRTLKISIRERDGYICQICGIQQGDKAHHIHHIDYNKTNCNPQNLITLCSSCHAKTNKNRDYWENQLSTSKKFINKL